MTVKEIVIEYLKANGYDGLWSDYPDHCGCGFDNLMPCDESRMEKCQPGFKYKCNCPHHGEPCVHIGPEKGTDDAQQD